MSAYANVHIVLEQMRVCALSAVRGSPISDEEADANPEPPRVLVLGPENSGKTTVCKILTNYAVRAGQSWSPLLVNVDPSEVCILTFRFLALILMLDTCAGWLVMSRSSLSGTRTVSSSNMFSGKPIRIRRYFCSHRSFIKCVVTSGLLVWTFKDQTESHATRKGYSDSWRKCR